MEVLDEGAAWGAAERAAEGAAEGAQSAVVAAAAADGGAQGTGERASADAAPVKVPLLPRTLPHYEALATWPAARARRFFSELVVLCTSRQRQLDAVLDRFNVPPDKRDRSNVLCGLKDVKRVDGKWSLHGASAESLPDALQRIDGCAPCCLAHESSNRLLVQATVRLPLQVDGRDRRKHGR